MKTTKSELGIACDKATEAVYADLKAYLLICSETELLEIIKDASEHGDEHTESLASDILKTRKDNRGKNEN